VNDVKEPAPLTLRKYGLTLEDWRALAEKQGYVCAVCELEPKSGRLVIDHEHVKGWKRLKPEKRRWYVRGLLCWFCNHSYVGRCITINKARNVLAYLERYQLREPPF
jgi:hypothetical protein